MKINYNVLFGSLIISIGIIIHGYITRSNIDDSLNNGKYNMSNNMYEGVLDMGEAAEYLNMTESEIKTIIIIEETKLKTKGRFTEERLSYFQVDKKYYFYKETLDRWLEDITLEQRKYNTKVYDIAY